MKYVIGLILVFGFSIDVASQTVKFFGTTFDPNGALVVKATITATDEKKRSVSSYSNEEGQFEINLAPGIHAVDVSAIGFLAIKLKEFFVVDSTTGKMSMDFVLFGAKYHEPCGVSGADCLPSKSLIRSYEITHSPKLRELRDEFAPNKKPKK